jgi:hypothetical protein
MPLARVGQKLIYFAHVPKCAGMTIEHYITQRFGPIAMLYNPFAKIPTQDRWSVTSPQHMPESVRQQYVPDGFIDASFSVVRHPAARLRSVFLFQREIEHRIAQTTAFSPWLETIAAALQGDPHIYDGHLRPMTEIVPDTACIFKLENGLSPVIDWLDDMAGTKDGPRTMRPVNALAARMARINAAVPSLKLTNADFDQIAGLYAADYEKFGYGTVPEKTEAFQT